MKKLKGAFVVALVGILLSTVSVVLMIFGNCWSDILGYASTVISIVLGLVSIVYTYKSGEETLMMFDEIKGILKETKDQNRRLVEKINYELSKENYDKENIDSIRRRT